MGHNVPEDLVELHNASSEYPTLSVRHLRYLRERRQVPSWRIGKRVWFSRTDLEQYTAAGFRPRASEP